jgi:hypothetical protein
MANAFTRGSAPGRARDASERSGSFKKGHKKVGGRQKGTPNLLSREYKDAVLEAAYRVGFDGSGQGGIIGYFMWIAAVYPMAYVIALIRLLELEYSYGADPDQPSSTVDEINERLRNQIGLTNSETARSRPKRELLDELIRIADEQPESFFKLVVALLPRPSVRQKFGVSN